MKANEEIYSVRFNKAVLKDGDIHFTIYTLGVPIFSYASLSPLIPESITLNPKTNKITVLFNNKEKHIISYTDDVELFIREKEKDGKENKNITDREGA